MPPKKTANTVTPMMGPASHHIEKAAYYKWLERGREVQVGDELKDWIEAEKDLVAAMKPGK